MAATQGKGKHTPALQLSHLSQMPWSHLSREQCRDAAAATSTLLGDRPLLPVPREERGSRLLGCGRPWLQAVESTAVALPEQLCEKRRRASQLFPLRAAGWGLSGEQIPLARPELPERRPVLQGERSARGEQRLGATLHHSTPKELCFFHLLKITGRAER